MSLQMLGVEVGLIATWTRKLPVDILCGHESALGDAIGNAIGDAIDPVVGAVVSAVVSAVVGDVMSPWRTWQDASSPL